MAVNSGFDNTRTDIPIDSSYVATGSTGEIKRLTYADGSTKILKTANDPSFNKAVTDEYFVMASHRNLSTIPKVFELFEAQPTRNAAFTMEDLSKFIPLDRVTDGQKFVDWLDTDTKVLFILDPVLKTLSAINKEGSIHNDFVLQNIMFDPSSGDVKLVDWGNVIARNNGNELRDVNTAQSLIKDLFSNSPESIPRPILDWSQKTFQHCEEGWQNYDQAIESSLKNNEIGQADEKWKPIQAAKVSN